MDKERLEYALKIIASNPGSTLDTAFSSMVNLIIENHEKTSNSTLSIQSREDSLKGAQRESVSPTEPQTSHKSPIESHKSHDLSLESHTSHDLSAESHTSHDLSAESQTIHETPTESFDVLKCRKTIKLTPIDDSSNYHDEDGFVYSLNNTNATKNLYYRCKYISGQKCRARVIVKDGNFETATLTQGHQHSPSKIDLCKTRLDAQMNKICNDRKFVTNRVAYSEARENTSEGDIPYLPGRQSYASFVQRRKKKFEPKIPHNLEEFESFLNDEKYKQRYTHDSRNQTFYRGIWKTKNNASMIAYLSETAMRVIQTEVDMIEIMMDGTFRILPSHIQFSQLYILSFTYQERSYPFGYVFMEKRDTDSYDCLFSNLISLWDIDVALKVFKIMTDYEKAVRKSAKKHFPNARRSGCFFHFVKAIKKAAKRFGLGKDERFLRPVLQACYIALLPNDHIKEGFECVKKQITGSTRWDRFCDYWEKQWLEANISVYGLRNRTDNFSETLNRSTHLLSGKPHQNIWHVIRTLQKVDTEKSDELLQHVDGRMFKTKKNQKMTELNKKILDAMLAFEETEDVATFLKNVSYRSDISLDIDDDEEDEDEEDEEDEGFEEEIIINDFDESCNFKRDSKKHRYADFFKRNDAVLKSKATKADNILKGESNSKRKTTNPKSNGTKRIKLF